MRTQVHDSTIRFRANAELLSKAEQRARANQMSLSELMRHALRRELREAA